MRKDVRMGFAVGGLLLAVIVVAVLVIHRNHNAGKTVAFDKGPSATTGDGSSTDAGAKPTDAPADASTPTPAPAAVTPVVAREPVAGAADARPVQDDQAEKGGSRWDSLFASNSEDPIKAQLTTGDSSRSSKSKSRKPAQPVAERQPAPSDAPAEAVANGQLDSGSRMESSPSAPRDVTVAASASPNSDAPRTHKIAQGETFVSISRMVYGDGRYYQAIVNANPNVSPEKLKPGMVIQLPPASQVKKASAKSSSKTTSTGSSNGPALAADGKTYTVQSGDNLYKIARKLYGKGEKGDELYAMNKDVIGPDSTRLKIGMVLKLPQPPTASR